MSARRTLATLVVVVPFMVFAKPPQLLGYQGRLLKTDGTPATGPVQLKFGLYDVATGGAPSATETQTVGLSNGYYATHLGQTAGSAFEAGLAAGTAYLQISGPPVGSSALADLSPRGRLRSGAHPPFAPDQSRGPPHPTARPG